jgi:tRNA(fMet)-specific endonuclease VapC
VLGRLADTEGNAAIAAVTWHELVYGVERLPDGHRRNALTVYLAEVRDRYPVLAYDSRAADWHAKERSRLEHRGTARSYVDSQIAAIAVTNGILLVTRNVTDFEGFSGLRVQSWWGEDGRP